MEFFPLEMGGTGESTIDGVKSVLELLFLKTSLQLDSKNSAGVIQGDFVVTGTFKPR